MAIQFGRQRRLGFESLEPRCLLSVSPVGVETQVNTYTSNQQTNPKIAADAAGDYVVVWTSYGQDGSQDGVYGNDIMPTARHKGASSASTPTRAESNFAGRSDGRGRRLCRGLG